MILSKIPSTVLRASGLESTSLERSSSSCSLPFHSIAAAPPVVVDTSDSSPRSFLARCLPPGVRSSRTAIQYTHYSNWYYFTPPKAVLPSYKLLAHQHTHTQNLSQSVINNKYILCSWDPYTPNDAESHQSIHKWPSIQTVLSLCLSPSDLSYRQSDINWTYNLSAILSTLLNLDQCTSTSAVCNFA